MLVVFLAHELRKVGKKQVCYLPLNTDPVENIEAKVRQGTLTGGNRK